MIVSQTLSMETFPDETDLVAIDELKKEFASGIATTLDVDKV
jgi:hypothetical protein